MSILSIVAHLCGIGNFVLSLLNYLDNRKKRKDNADEKIKG
jgi:hypothetical protein